MTIVALAGGVGAARFLEGLIRVVPQRKLTVIGNVGDDIEMHGLHVSPDLDIVTYTLAGIVDQAKGWGIRNDTFTCQEVMKKYGYETWFNIGDKDLQPTSTARNNSAKARSLSEVTDELVKKLGSADSSSPFNGRLLSNARFF